ncbi:septal ring lytic transglycosylase RlpA family protein [Flavihumibacter sp. UBA7668]|uniref:septal ring lytic transglycosylase RlpA family protein n=1 Tax=Flavihumibacter sp. UBA7668 TaxID=1946542 RepID=UPI0025C2AA01|nr:septal ring lytic transglycosylase RlpA family protein [Flavihumibacter sp. UBA7668]
MTIKTIILLIGICCLLQSGEVFAQDSSAQVAVLIDSAKLASAPPIQKKRVVNLDPVQYGVASYYAPKFQGRKTANGERYDSTKLTAAHNGLAFGTWIKVTNQRNGRSVIVKINDRLHYANKRVVDLSGSAAKKLGFYKRGLTKVKVEVLGKKKPTEQ